ncbi:MAG: glycosyltransferase family 32 protein [Pseudorhodobacter sp.]
MAGIPQRLGHIWIGPKPAPAEWMRSWPAKHPGWSYTLYGNNTLVGYPFRLRRLINEYAWRGAWAGVQDMMRYELLYAFGGFMADADAICLHPVDELLQGARAFTVYDRPESNRFRGVCPILACEPQHPFLGTVIDRLAEMEPWELRRPEVSTGNRFLMRMIRELRPGPEMLHVWPTHYFIPWQKDAPDQWYDGPDKVYAEQKWGSSTWAYNRDDGPAEKPVPQRELDVRTRDIHKRLAEATGQTTPPGPDEVVARATAAEKMGAMARAFLDQPEIRADIADIGHVIEKAMSGAGLDHRVHGAFFYRHMQNDSIATGNLRSRSIALRGKLLGWLATARNVLMIGFDTGHLALTALRLNPELRIAGVDAGRWDIDKDLDPPQRKAYIPAVADWLNGKFGDRVLMRAMPESQAMGDPDFTAWGPFDLVLFAAPDIAALRVLHEARAHLTDGAVVLSASTLGQGGCDFATRLLLQDMAYQPIAFEDFGAQRGSYAVTQLKGGGYPPSSTS